MPDSNYMNIHKCADIMVQRIKYSAHTQQTSQWDFMIEHLNVV